MSDSVRPHGLQPTRLLHPWDFPGKSTGVGCHCLLRGKGTLTLIQGFNSAGLPSGAVVKNLPAKPGTWISSPGSGRSPGEGNGNALQYSCLGNPMDGEAWWVIVHGFAKSWTRLSACTHTHARMHIHTHTHTHKGIGNFFSL